MVETVRNNPFALNVFLALLWGLVLGACVAIQTVWPGVNISPADIPAMTVLVLQSLFLEGYDGNAQHSMPLQTMLGAMTLGLLPVAAGMAGLAEGLVMTLQGGLVFAAVVWVMDESRERIVSGGGGKTALTATGGILFLASLAFCGISL